MKKFVDPMPDGKAPAFWNEGFNLIFKDIYDLLDVMIPDQEFHTQYGNGDGIIISGCVSSDNGANQDITAGIVFLPKIGAFLRVPAQTNVADPIYVTEDTTIVTQELFKDGVNRDYVADRVALVASGVPGDNNYVRIAQDVPENTSKRLSNLTPREYSGSLVLGDFTSGVTAVTTANYKYVIAGKLLYFAFNFTIDTNSTAIRFNIPGGFIHEAFADEMFQRQVIKNDGSNISLANTAGNGEMSIQDGGSFGAGRTFAGMATFILA